MKTLLAGILALSAVATYGQRVTSYDIDPQQHYTDERQHFEYEAQSLDIQDLVQRQQHTLNKLGLQDHGHGRTRDMVALTYYFDKELVYEEQFVDANKDGVADQTRLKFPGLEILLKDVDFDGRNDTMYVRKPTEQRIYTPLK